MTQKQLDEIKARGEAAIYLLDNIIHANCAYEVYCGLIESAQDIPDLVAEVERLRALATWIPCSERMPPVDDCICYEANRLGVTPCIGGEWEATDWNATHWMPLPKAPEVLDG